MAVEAPRNEWLRSASINRLACLLRHWAWADEAKVRFDRELALGWQYDEDPRADHLLGAFYHWCALLCSFTEASLPDGILSQSQLEVLGPDLEASLAVLRASQRLLQFIPESREEHPRIVDLLRDAETLARFRRVHDAIGAALQEEQMSRELAVLDT